MLVSYTVSVKCVILYMPLPNGSLRGYNRSIYSTAFFLLFNSCRDDYTVTIYSSKTKLKTRMNLIGRLKVAISSRYHGDVPLGC